MIMYIDNVNLELMLIKKKNENLSNNLENRNYLLGNSM